MSPRKKPARAVYQVIESPYTASRTEKAKASLFFSNDARRDFLVSTQVKFFGDYLVDSSSTTSMTLVYAGQMPTLLGRLFLYLFTLGAYVFWDPKLQRKRPERITLEVDERLVATAYLD